MTNVTHCAVDYISQQNAQFQFTNLLDFSPSFSKCAEKSTAANLHNNQHYLVVVDVVVRVRCSVPFYFPDISISSVFTADPKH